MKTLYYIYYPYRVISEKKLYPYNIIVPNNGNRYIDLCPLFRVRPLLIIYSGGLVNSPPSISLQN